MSRDLTLDAWNPLLVWGRRFGLLEGEDGIRFVDGLAAVAKARVGERLDDPATGIVIDSVTTRDRAFALMYLGGVAAGAGDPGGLRDPLPDRVKRRAEEWVEAVAFRADGGTNGNQGTSE